MVGGPGRVMGLQHTHKRLNTLRVEKYTMIEVSLSEHHMRAQKMFRDAAKRGEITVEESDQLYTAWLKRRHEAHPAKPAYRRQSAEHDLFIRNYELPTDEFEEMFPRWWGEAPIVVTEFSPAQLRALHMFGPQMNHGRVLSLLDAMTERGYLTRVEAVQVYRVWGSMSRFMRRGK